ncbi:MAG: alpha/beta hydrolase [Marmoricola sp.]|nr:alpha/beta hydrolase [Marmoricola sp.]
MADRTGVATVGEIQLAWEAYGDPADPPLLLVMGLATQMLGWDERFCLLLADLGLHVVRFDNRDIGASTHLTDRGLPDLAALLAGGPDAPAPAYTLLDMAQDTVGLLDALGLDSAHVVGASMGGMIAQQVAIDHPERVRSLTSIMSTPSRDIGRPTPEAQAALVLPPATDVEGAVQRSLQVYSVIGSPGFPLDVAHRTDVARRSFERAGDPTGSARQYAAILASPDRTPGLRALRVPTLVLHGEDDPLVQLAGGQATADAVPGARLVVLPGMGHDLPEPLWPRIVEEVATLVRAAERARGTPG